ncbi:MAG TPA: secretion system protein F [Chloroflexi bacterium]|jgi:tight adherence protein B|nr:secretion system protein F [Chloroflexota bacterium]
MGGPLLVAAMLALAVFIVFVGLWRMVGASGHDPVDERLQQYGVSDAALAPADVAARPRLARTNRLLARLSFGPRLAAALASADLPLTAAEFALIMLGLGAIGFLLAALRSGPLVGLAVGAALAYLPLLYLNNRRNKRRRAFTEQLPDVLTLLVGALRAGHGLTQAIEMLVDQVPPPASVEFARVMRAVSLGLPVQRALADMAERVDSDDADLVVTAIAVQYEMGGNLAQTLDIISDTVRDRIRMQREVRVLTAQQRLTGYILAGLPIALAIMLNIVNPGYMKELFEPGWIRLVPAIGIVMQVAGFLIIRRIVDIEV